MRSQRKGRARNKDEPDLSKQGSDTEVREIRAQRVASHQERPETAVFKGQQHVRPCPINEIDHRSAIACDGRIVEIVRINRKEPQVAPRYAVLTHCSIPFEFFSL